MGPGDLLGPAVDLCLAFYKRNLGLMRAGKEAKGWRLRDFLS